MGLLSTFNKKNDNIKVVRDLWTSSLFELRVKALHKSSVQHFRPPENASFPTAKQSTASQQGTHSQRSGMGSMIRVTPTPPHPLAGKPNSETDFRPATFHRNGDCVGNTLAVLCSGGSVSAVPMARLLGVIKLVSLHTHTQRGVVRVEVPEVASELTRASPTAITPQDWRGYSCDEKRRHWLCILSSLVGYSFGK